MKPYLEKSWIDPRITVGKSAIHGTGMIATAPIKEGERVMIWGGTVVSRVDYESVWEQFHNASVIQIDEENYLALPITIPETIDVHLNHSCDPNTWLVDEVTIVARRDIKMGEEITLDSATWNDDESEEYSDNDLCTCGSPLCRTFIKATDWHNLELQKKYAGHFSPYLARRIAELTEQLKV